MYKKDGQSNFLLVLGARKENKVGARLRQEQRHGARFGGGLGSGVTKPPLQGVGSPTTVPGQPAAPGSPGVRPRPGSEAAAGSGTAFSHTPSGRGGGAQPAQVPLPWLGTHPGSLRGLLCGWSQGAGARGRADEQGEDGRVEPCSPRVPRSGVAAFASDPVSGGAGGGAANRPGLPPPPARTSQPRAPGLLSGKAGPRRAPCRPDRRQSSPSTRGIRWPITATDGFQVLPSLLANPRLWHNF